MTSSKGYALALKLTPLLKDSYTTNRLAEHCSLLCRTQASLHRLAEARCERELSPQEERNDERYEEIAARHLKAIGELLIVTPRLIINGDPRGPALKIAFDSEQHRHLYDCFGGEGICVP